MSEFIGGAGASSGGGGAVTIADGSDVAEGSKADAAWVSGDGTVISLLKKIASAGGSAVSIADGSDVAEGTTTDAAVVTDVNGTVSGKLRGLVKIFADIWNSVTHSIGVHNDVLTNSYDAVNQRLDVAIQNTPAVTVTGSVTANAGTNLDTSALALNATLLGLLLAQGASATAATGPLVLGAASDSPVTLLDGNVYPLSLTNDGRLRVVTLNESTNYMPWGSPEAWGSDSSYADSNPLCAW